MSEPRERLPSHIRRLIVFSVAVVVGVVWVYAAIPRSYVDRSLHRRLTVEREAARELSFAGTDACDECHQEVRAVALQGPHHDVSCEVCHGPSAAHTQDDAIKPPAPRGRTLCPVCHLYDPARPTGFPQINPVVHNPVVPCIRCHAPHDPTPSGPPRVCTACHGDIGRTQSLSPHALLDCVTCHEAPEEHKVTPRNIKPAKPKTRSFCGGCHGVGAERSDAPKVDIATHGEKYLCWQCHYAHMPELH